MRTIGTADLIDHAVIQGGQKIAGALRQKPLRIVRQAAEIHHVREALLTRIAAIVLRGLRLTRKAREEAPRIARRRLQGLRAKGIVCCPQGRQLGKIRHRKRRRLCRIIALTIIDIRITDGLAQPCTIHRRVLGQCADPASICPAIAGLKLLGADHIARDARKRLRHVDCRHQAGIEAHKLKWRIAFVRSMHRSERVAHIIKAQDMLGALVQAHTSSRTAAMIPENENTMVCLIIVLAELQEGSQRIPRAHIRIRQRSDRMQAIRIIQITADRIRRDSLRLPLLGAARLDDDLHIGRQLHLLQLLQILRSSPAARFQIRTTNIPIHQPGIRRIIGIRKLRRSLMDASSSAPGKKDQCDTQPYRCQLPEPRALHLLCPPSDLFRRLHATKRQHRICIIFAIDRLDRGHDGKEHPGNRLHQDSHRDCHLDIHDKRRRNDQKRHEYRKSLDPKSLPGMLRHKGIALLHLPDQKWHQKITHSAQEIPQMRCYRQRFLRSRH